MQLSARCGLGLSLPLYVPSDVGGSVVSAVVAAEAQGVAQSVVGAVAWPGLFRTARSPVHTGFRMGESPFFVRGSWCRS